MTPSTPSLSPTARSSSPVTSAGWTTLQGNDFKGPGAVDRLGIGAIDPVVGTALPWNPGKIIEGVLGGFDLYFTDLGLWVGHFEKYLGRKPNGTRELHEVLGLLPF